MRRCDNDENDFLSIKEFAFLLNVHPNTIRRAVKNGRISAFKIGFGERSVYRIAKTEINRMSLMDLEMVIEKIIEKKNS